MGGGRPGGGLHPTAARDGAPNQVAAQVSGHDLGSQIGWHRPAHVPCLEVGEGRGGALRNRDGEVVGGGHPSVFGQGKPAYNVITDCSAVRTRRKMLAYCSLRPSMCSAISRLSST